MPVPAEVIQNGYGLAVDNRALHTWMSEQSKLNTQLQIMSEQTPERLLLTAGVADSATASLNNSDTMERSTVLAAFKQLGITEDLKQLQSKALFLQTRLKDQQIVNDNIQAQISDLEQVYSERYAQRQQLRADSKADPLVAEVNAEKEKVIQQRVKAQTELDEQTQALDNIRSDLINVRSDLVKVRDSGTTDTWTDVCIIDGKDDDDVKMRKHLPMHLNETGVTKHIAMRAFKGALESCQRDESSGLWSMFEHIAQEYDQEIDMKQEYDQESDMKVDMGIQEGCGADVEYNDMCEHQARALFHAIFRDSDWLASVQQLARKHHYSMTYIGLCESSQ